MLVLPQVNVHDMDLMHREELEVLQRLLVALESEDDVIVERRFDALSDHMQKHFAFEERLMHACHYPMQRLHKGEHDKTLNRMRMMEMEWRTRRDRGALCAYLDEEIPEWLEQHIKAMDTTLAAALGQAGSGAGDDHANPLV